MKLTQKHCSPDQTSSTVCEEKLPDAECNDLVKDGPDCASPAMMAEQKQQNPSSHSIKTSFHSVFDKAHGVGAAQSKIRKVRKKKDFPPPPANNTKITDHFKPSPASTQASNEPDVNLRRKPGEKL